MLQILVSREDILVYITVILDGVKIPNQNSVMKYIVPLPGYRTKEIKSDIK